MERERRPACVADDDGRRCGAEPVMHKPVTLCLVHKAEMALIVVPDLLRTHLAVVRGEEVQAGTPADDRSASAVPVRIEPLRSGTHAPIVYFIANGGRVKIGYTTNLSGRLAALSLRFDGVLLALDGGPELERALHARFARFRDSGTEWFELAPEVIRFITTKSAAAPRRSTRQPQHRSGSTLAGPMEAEIAQLTRLMGERGGPAAVSLNDARRLLNRPKATAAKRLAAARARYLNDQVGEL